MRRYLSTLACSGLLSIGALYGAPAFAGSIPRSISDIAPTVGSAWNGDLGGSVQLVRGGGFMRPHGGGFHGGGFHGGGFRGSGFHGHFDHGGHFHNGHFHNAHFHNGHFHNGHFHNDNFFFDGGALIGVGLPLWYSYCDPYYANYYGSCYPGYYPGY